MRLQDDSPQGRRSANMKSQDFKDLFSTLMVSLPLTPHRVRFSKIEHSFTTEEAITNLGSLKFSQSNRMPDPKDPSRIVTTTTTTTFSMAKEMARSVCNKFLEARFVETCEGKAAFDSRNSVWQLTPKGMRVLTRFCSRNGIHQRHVNEVLDSPRNMLQMVILERDMETDKLNHDRSTIEVIFRRFAGPEPNVKASSAASDTDSLSEYSTGLVGVRVLKSAKTELKDSPYVFNGKAAIDWLVDCCMVVDRRECHEMANLFMAHDLISQLREERNPNESAQNRRFQPVKTAHYSITERGMKLAGWTRSPSASINGDHLGKLSQTAANSRDSNNNRMQIILRDPALRLLFREFLQETHCEENLTFYVEVKMFLAEYAVAKRANPPRLDLIRENLASAYSLYNAFLAPGSPCELNIDHNLRNALAGRMTRAVGEDSEMLTSLDEVAVLFDQAQTSVFKLMASDSVPKFSRDPKYATTLRDRNFEHLLTTFSGTA
ncbi:regulator of G protein signaling domain-containing protein [Elsinoe ampelina]|uniref:Regulator of G protein signaling domain-containing protein n=1 Tax=Elsinoe ampelina TaxID=302913 RepID=A0A6A6G317_9PEZI|nr:regulator of G protein signaling domain-containing protein [Elsinoe ampelina]